MENKNSQVGYVIMMYFYHNSCVVSLEFGNVLKYVVNVYKDSVN